MKKKTVKKLVLSKETMRSLEGLGGVQGGANPTNTDCASACFICEDEVGGL
jgi:hypothetical protein